MKRRLTAAERERKARVCRCGATVPVLIGPKKCDACLQAEGLICRTCHHPYLRVDRASMTTCDPCFKKGKKRKELAGSRKDRGEEMIVPEVDAAMVADDRL